VVFVVGLALAFWFLKDKVRKAFEALTSRPS
jgi:hypothetical protein